MISHISGSMAPLSDDMLVSGDLGVVGDRFLGFRRDISLVLGHGEWSAGVQGKEKGVQVSLDGVGRASAQNLTGSVSSG